jgi:hypothetical protein
MGEIRMEMNLTKLFLSKLVQACEKEWIPESDGGLFGEHKLATADLKELKRLVYRPKNCKTFTTIDNTELIKR